MEFLGARRRLGLVLEGFVVLVAVPEPRLVAWALVDMSFSSRLLATQMMGISVAVFSAKPVKNSTLLTMTRDISLMKTCDRSGHSQND